eukprot:CAMPEP_0197434560 /NCGR_PEP_ID=MMETSP1175-20131217/2268_1 /TAXON_ID=1003142 /ORGANISM="Triceratium dubium, Strain CCMP147" /LENGTH=127 /DNA_ID=CAMNT_0042963321 /DNA_START=74 /DNA_END=457 /DNA_ORIENTATION=-
MVSLKNRSSLFLAVISLVGHHRVHAQSSSKLRGTQKGLSDEIHNHPAGSGATSVGEKILLRQMESVDGLKPSTDLLMNPPHDCRCEKSSECQSGCCHWGFMDDSLEFYQPIFACFDVPATEPFDGCV